MNSSYRQCYRFFPFQYFLYICISLASILCAARVTCAALPVTQTSSEVTADSVAINPFAITNYNPLPQMFGFPRDYVTRIIGEDQARYALIYDKTSFFTAADSPSEQLFFDGESTHTTFIFQQGIDGRYQWGITIPYVSFEGGSLDAFIIDWHDTFHLPQSGRDVAARNQLKLYYRRNGVTQFDVTQDHSGIGDISLNGSVDLSDGYSDTAMAKTFNLSIKLPTGDEKQMLGSGALDLAAWLSGHRSTESGGSGYKVYGRLGAMALGKADVLADQQRRLLAFGGVGAGFRYNQTLRFKSQIDFHTSLYKDSAFSQLTRYAIPFTLGGELAFGRNTRLDIGVTEDLYVDVSPDVSFHFGLYTTF